MNRSAQLLAVFMLLVIARPASAQMLAGEGLIKALRQGGYVIVMRHASSPREVPTKLTADAGNVKLERQLDEAGRAGSVAMGRALRDLIPRARDRALGAVGESSSADLTR